MQKQSHFEQKEVRMTTTGLKKWLLICVTVPAVLSGCNRDEEERIMQEAEDISTEQAAMVGEMEKAQSLFFDATEQASYASGQEEQSATDCYKIGYNEEGGDMRFSVDFGKNGCKDQYGNLRKGKLTQINRTTDKGVEMSYRLDGYQVNGYTLTGTVSVSSLKRDEKNMLSYSYKINDGKVNTPDGKSYIVNRALEFKQVESAGSQDFKVTGGGSVINASGVEYSSEIVAPVTYKGGCFNEGNFYPIAGAAQVDFEDGKFYTLEFGNGSCDKAANIKAGDKTLAVALK